MSATHTQALADLKRQLGEETVAARTLDAQAEAAHADLAAARDAVVAAHADQDSAAVKKATSARDKAEARLSELADKQAAVQMRIERAGQAVTGYAGEHARDMLEERKAEARELAEDLTRAGREVVRQHRAYLNLRTEIDGLVAAVPGATSRADGPAPSHPWERQLRDLERAIQETPEVPAPLPRWTGLTHREQQDYAHSVERARRRGELSADDQAALAIGRVVTVK